MSPKSDHLWLKQLERQTQSNDVLVFDLDELGFIKRPKDRIDDSTAPLDLRSPLTLETLLVECTRRQICLRVKRVQRQLLVAMTDVLKRYHLHQPVIIACRYEGCAELLMDKLPRAMHCMPFSQTTRWLLSSINGWRYPSGFKYSMINIPTPGLPTSVLSQKNLEVIQRNGLLVNIPVTSIEEIEEAIRMGVNGVILPRFSNLDHSLQSRGLIRQNRIA